MIIFNIVEIYDNGEFVSLATETGSIVHLPPDARHSITIKDIKEEDRPTHTIAVIVDLYQ